MSAWGSSSSPFRSCEALFRRIESNDPTLSDLMVLPTKIWGDAEVDRVIRIIHQRIPNEPKDSNTSQSGSPLDLSFYHWQSLSASSHKVSPDALRRLGNAIAKSNSSSSRLATSSSNPPERLLQRISALAIADQSMGDEGVTALCEGFEQGSSYTTSNSYVPTCSLERLDLSFKNMTLTGFLALVNCHYLAHQTRLQSLNLSRNDKLGNRPFVDSGDDTATGSPRQPSRVAPFSSLCELDMSDCCISTDFIQNFLPLVLPIPCAQAQDEDDKPKPDFVLRLARNASLGDNGFSALMGHLVFNNSAKDILGELHLSSCRLGDDSMELLAGIKRDSELTFTNTLEIGSVPCGIRVLDLSNNDLTATGALALALTLTPTVTMNHDTDGHVKDIDDEGPSRVLFYQLRDLNLAGNAIGPGGQKAIVDALITRYRYRCYAKGLLSHTQWMPMGSLDLSETNCDVATTCYLMEQQHHTGLVSLRLFNNRLGSDGFRMLAKTIRNNTENAIPERGDELKSDNDPIVPQSRLETLDLAGNDADQAAVVELLESLLLVFEKKDEKWEKLQTLVIGGNRTGDQVEETVNRIRQIRPLLDIARDKPRRKQN